MNKADIIRNIEKKAKKFFVGASGCHDWTHVERVRLLAKNIGKKEKADLFVLDAASLLHDIAKNDEMIEKGLFCHAQEGVKMARKILQKMKFSEELISKIVHCIGTHRKRGKTKPESLEARVLYDADKLDSIGAIGVARDFLFAGNAGSGTLYTGNEKKLMKSGKDHGYTEEDSAILEYETQLKFIKNKMLTETGKLIAEERDEYMRNFFKRFWLEVGGKK